MKKEEIKKFIILTVCVAIFILLLVMMKYFSISRIMIEDNSATVYINFILPMYQENQEQYIKVRNDLGQDYNIETNWISSNKLMIKLNEVNFPKGLDAELIIDKMPSKLLVSKYITKNIKFVARPELLEVEPHNQVTTKGPITMKFSTFIDKESLEKSINCDFDFTLHPMRRIEKKGIVYDYSTWLMYPVNRLENEREYQINIKSGLKSDDQMTAMENSVDIMLITLEKPSIIGVKPQDGETEIDLYPTIVCECSHDIKKAIVRFEEEKGDVVINKNTVMFRPDNVLEPNREYSMIIEVISKDGELSDSKEVTFTTKEVYDNEKWVEVVLGNEQKVIVRQGNAVLKTMDCSGGLPESPTVKGTFKLRDRGEKFFSKRFGEGATYWVRISKQYLFHGIPRDEDWNIIKSELDKIGQPASHGCVRLREEDAKWFYENVPHGSTVIIHD